MDTETRHCRVCSWALGVGVVLVVAGWLASGLYTIRPSEVGVVRRFGKVVTSMIDGASAPAVFGPGLHYRLPWPVTRLDRVRLAETKTATVGFDRVDDLLGLETDSRPSEVLTGDQNIMRLRMTVQYTIGDPVAYLFASRSPDEVVRSEAGSCLAAAVASTNVDRLIGPERVRVGSAVSRELSRVVEERKLGVRIGAVSLQAPTPPKEVAAAFNDVQSAKAEKRRLVLEAEAYQSEVVTKAHGEAYKTLRDGEAYRQRRVAEAEGEAKRFEALYEQYRQAEGVTRLRLYLETMEEILPRMRKVFVDSSEDGAPIDLGILGARR